MDDDNWDPAWDQGIEYNFTSQAIKPAPKPVKKKAVVLQYKHSRDALLRVIDLLNKERAPRGC